MHGMTPGETVESNTYMLRSSSDPFWSRLRALLLGHGVDPRRTSVAYVHGEDSSCLVGEVATLLDNPPVVKRFFFEFDFLHRPVDKGAFTVWRDVTTDPVEEFWAEDVATAQALVLKNNDDC